MGSAMVAECKPFETWVDNQIKQYSIDEIPTRAKAGDKIALMINPRDMRSEVLEEMLDAVVYLSARLVQLRRVAQIGEVSPC